MRIEEVEVGGHRDVTVVLSRRNLLSMLHKLDFPGSARTIFSEGAGIDGTLILKAEDDDEHYNHPNREAKGYVGPMHPDTEAFIREENNGSVV